MAMSWLSSPSSAISWSLRLLRELLEDETEAEAVCSKHAAETAVSLRSEGEVTEKTVSWGLNLSIMD